MLLFLSGGPDTRREAGVSGFEGTLTLLKINPPAAPKGQFSGVSTHLWLPGAQKVNLRRPTAASRRGNFIRTQDMNRNRNLQVFNFCPVKVSLKKTL